MNLYKYIFLFTMLALIVFGFDLSKGNEFYQTCCKGYFFSKQVSLTACTANAYDSTVYYDLIQVKQSHIERKNGTGR